ncbi:MAG: hypothetical protein D6744_01560 [Planctomycetota bacterium]|nr:MAG: hypothetical protein D6744_01560 [Planctomycetota bacterium]
MLVVFSQDRPLPIRPVDAIVALVGATGADAARCASANEASEEGSDGDGGGPDAKIKRLIDSLYRAAGEYGVSADTVDRAIFGLSILPLWNPLPQALGLAEEDHGKLVLPYATDDDITHLVEHARDRIAEEHPVAALMFRALRPPEWWRRLRVEIVRTYWR